MKTWPIEPPGVWIDVRSSPVCSPRPGLFLDRDGVIVHDKGYLASPDHVELLPDAAEMIAEANRCAAPVAVVTNQSGIARRLFGWAEFTEVEREIARRLDLVGARVDAVLVCPFHPEFTENYGEREAHWRKPGPGLILEAARALNIDIGTSWLVGDQTWDIEAARKAGLAGAIHLSSEATSARHNPEQTVRGAEFRTSVASRVVDAIAYLKAVGLLNSHCSPDILPPI